MNNNRLTKLYSEWQPYLSWFDNTLQPILAELLSQLNQILGPIKENQALNNDYHSGLGEVKQRGHYENLLLSEWLLFEDEPDEFLRRAVSHEHLFLTPTPEEQKSNNAIIALFDEGILQLGKARLIHLVMMLLLAHRATKQNSQFYWGIIQKPAALHPFSGITSLLTLLENKHLSPCNNQYHNQWSRHLEHIDADERWFIGANITATTLQFEKLVTHCTYIHQQVTENHKLNVSIVAQGKTRSSLVSLPKEIICVKILLGQLTPNSHYAHSVLVPISTDFAPCVSMNGSSMAALTQERKHVLLCSLVDTLSAKQKCKVTFPPINGELLAFDFQHKRIIALIKNNSQLAVWQPNKPLKPIMIDADHLTMGTTQYTKFMLIYNDHGHSIYLIDNHNTLWRYDINKQISANQIYQAIEIDKHVLSLFKLNDTKCLYVSFNDAGDLRIKSPQLKHINYLLPESSKAVTQIYIADQKNWLKGAGVVALGMQHQWHLLKSDPTTEENTTLLFSIPAQWSVLGLRQFDQQTQLVLLHQDGKKVATFNPENHDIDEVYYSSNTIVQSYFSMLSNSLALITENHELTLYSFDTDSIRIIIKNKEGTC